MLGTSNALLIVGGATTVTVAVLLATPAPLSVAVTAPVVLFFTPAVVPVTLMDTVQFPLEAIVPAESERLPDPATAVAVPLQVLLRLFGVATTRPAGNVSVTATPVRPRLV